MKEARERIIYDNYYLYETYPDEEIIENLIENGIDKDDITDERIWDTRYFWDELDWDNAHYDLKDFFNNTNKKWIIMGTVGLWTGNHKAGIIFKDFDKMFYDATKDCDYIKFYDKNGHFYFECSHHDGTNYFEIKEITQKGVEYLERWEDNWDDKRSEEYVHTQIFNRYSRLPNFVNKVYGSKKLEYVS